VEWQEELASGRLGLAPPVHALAELPGLYTCEDSASPDLVNVKVVRYEGRIN
jgi:hypothetical protein